MDTTLKKFRKWGSQGGKARATKLSAKRRSEIARKAGLARAEKAREKAAAN